MKPERRKKVISIAESPVKEGISAPWYNKYGNTILTGLLVAMSVALLVRWRLSAATLEKQRILGELNDARAEVDQLRSVDAVGSPADVIRAVQTIETKANGDLSDVLNTSGDADVKAKALVIRGDLYWHLANLPELPGATTQPILRLKKSSDELLTQAADAYNSVVNSSDYASAHDAVNSARLGLVAIAENRGQWAAARTQLDAIKGDPHASAEKLAAADIQLDMMVNNIQDPIYLAPPTGTLAATTLPATLPAAIPATLPAIPTGMPIIPTTQPVGLLPTTRPK